LVFHSSTVLTYYEFKEQNLEMPSYRYRVIFWLIANVSEEMLSENTSSPQSLKDLPGRNYLTAED